MSGKTAILSDVTAARDEARNGLHRLPITAQHRFYDLEARLETLQHQLSAGAGAEEELLLQEAKSLSGQLLRLVRQLAA